jgi:hypothetical protein
VFLRPAGMCVMSDDLTPGPADLESWITERLGTSGNANRMDAAADLLPMPGADSADGLVVTGLPAAAVDAARSIRTQLGL